MTCDESKEPNAMLMGPLDVHSRESKLAVLKTFTITRTKCTHLIVDKNLLAITALLLVVVISLFENRK